MLSIVLQPQPERKKRRLEEMKESFTVNKFSDLIGRGQLSISAAAELARSFVSRICL